MEDDFFNGCLFTGYFDDLSPSPLTLDLKAPAGKPVTEKADMSPSEETAIIKDSGKFPVQKVAVTDIKAKPEELQFKLDVNDSGVQKPLDK